MHESDGAFTFFARCGIMRNRVRGGALGETVLGNRNHGNSHFLSHKEGLKAPPVRSPKTEALAVVLAHIKAPYVQ